MRNINKQTAQGNEILAKHPNASLSMGEVCAIYDRLLREAAIDGELGGAVYSTVADVFAMGCAVGARIATSEQKKKHMAAARK